MFGKNEDEKYTLTKEAAESEIQKIFDFYDIDLDELEDKEAKKIIKGNYNRVIKAIRMKRLEVKNEKGLQIIHHLRDHDETLTYYAPDANAKTAMDEYAPTALYRRIYALMGACSKLGEGAIMKLPANELSIVEVIGSIFLSS